MMQLAGLPLVGFTRRFQAARLWTCVDVVRELGGQRRASTVVWNSKGSASAVRCAFSRSR